MFVEGTPRTVFFLQTLYFTAFIATVEKIITYALGEHDPGSAQDWRTSNDFCSPVLCLCYTGQNPEPTGIFRMGGKLSQREKTATRSNNFANSINV